MGSGGGAMGRNAQTMLAIITEPVMGPKGASQQRPPDANKIRDVFALSEAMSYVARSPRCYRACICGFCR